MERHLVLFFFLLQRNVVTNGGKESARYHLMEKLFGNNSYPLTRDIIPLSSENTVIHVHFDFDVHQILELNEKKQVMWLNIWLRMNWTNSFLKWKPEEYNGVRKITVEKEKVWFPDLTLWNRAVDDASVYHRIDTKIVVEHDGNCSWYGPVSTRSTCAIRVRYFPFDNQTCWLEFGSWRHTTEDLVFVPCEKTCGDMRYFIPNSEWSLDYIHGQVKDEKLHTGEYSVIKCRLELSRKSLFYIMNMIVPCTIIALLCCLTFYLPANNGERTSLVITVLLAMTVYMLIVADSMPPTSEAMPLVQKFYLITIIETAFCLFATCLVIKWHENTAPMPDWVYKVFNCVLKKLLRVEYTYKEKDVDSSSVVQPVSPVINSVRHKENKEIRSTRHNSRKSSEASEIFQFQHNSFFPHSSIQETIPDVTVPSRSEDVLEVPPHPEETPRDWKLAATVLNKVFLVIFSVIFVLSMAVIFAGVKSWF